MTDKTTKKQRVIGRPFPKGVSGNPKGRPKGSRNWSTIFKLALKKIAESNNLKISDPEVALVQRAVIEALKGNYNFYKDLMDRRFGKPKEQVELEEEKKYVIVLEH